MAKQRCPNCLKLVDVAIYVSGRRLPCPFCRIPFVVERKGGKPTESQPGVQRTFSMTEAETTPSRPVRALGPDGQPADFGSDTPAPLQDAPDIPGFRLDAVLGVGAMGTVYRAVQLSTGLFVAIKFLSEKLQTSPEFVARFEREVAALAAVDHPCVVKLLDHGSVKEQPYFAMEFVEGASLRAEYAVTHPVPARVVAILKAVTEGLLAAHDAGVIHRDLKPENIVVTPDGGVRIVDFGLAGLFGDGDPHPNLTRSRVTMGTVNYMAPEQRTDAKYVDKRADIYALGVMLYEGLTGDLPVGRFKYTAERGLGLPSHCDTVLSRCLAKEPQDRYDSAAELLEDLSKLAKVLRSAALADTAPPRPSVMVRDQVAVRRKSLRETILEKGPRRWAVVAAVALGITAGAFAFGWRYLGNAPAYEIVVEKDGVNRSSNSVILKGSSLGLASNGQTSLTAKLGEWTYEEQTLVHRSVAQAVHLQPLFAQAIVNSPAAEPLKIRVALARPPIPASARQAALAAGFANEARFELPVRVGLGFAHDTTVGGGYIDADGTCGYFLAKGIEIQVWEQVCGEGGDQEAVIELTRGEEGFVLKIDDLHLPPQRVMYNGSSLQPALLCQNAHCTFQLANTEAKKSDVNKPDSKKTDTKKSAQRTAVPR